MVYPITLIPGDGIGPEVANATVKVVNATGIEIDWHTHDAGNEVINKISGLLSCNLIILVVVFGISF